MNFIAAKHTTTAAPDLSPKYSVIQTTKVYELLADYGFREDRYRQSRERNREREAYSKHVSILQRDQDCDQHGGFNLLLVNSHNGTSALHLEAGYFRILCENQLGHGDVGVRIRHTGDVLSKIERAIPQVIYQMEEFKQLVAKLKGKPLSLEQIDILVRKGLELRGLPNIPENHVKMQIMRRREERDAWSIFNAVQENVVRGGIRFYTQQKDPTTKEIIEGAYDYRMLRPINAAERLLSANRELTRTAHELLNVA